MNLLRSVGILSQPSAGLFFCLGLQNKKPYYFWIWMQIWIYILWICLTISCCISQECSSTSLSVIGYKLFDRKNIRCITASGPDQLCQLNFLWPNTIKCTRPETKLPSPWTSRSPADEYARGAWRCESDRSWVQYSSMVCPGNITACETSISESCHAEFDPSVTLAYLMLLIFGCIAIFGCMCCAGICGFVIHYNCNASRKKSMYSRNYIP